MTSLFLSHASADDAVVRRLQQALADLGQDVWIDSRGLRGGDLLWLAISQAIESAAGFAVLVSTDALQSRWVGKELSHALEVQAQRGRDRYPVIPLALDGTQLGVLETYFSEVPLYIPISSAPGGIDAALDAILTALARRLPADLKPTPQPAPEPIEDLVLELTNLRFDQTPEGIRRPTARAGLVHEPAPGLQGPAGVRSRGEHSWRLTAPWDRSRWTICAGTWRNTPSGPAPSSRNAPSASNRASRAGSGPLSGRAAPGAHRQLPAILVAHRRPGRPALLSPGRSAGDPGGRRSAGRSTHRLRGGHRPARPARGLSPVVCPFLRDLSPVVSGPKPSKRNPNHGPCDP